MPKYTFIDAQNSQQEVDLDLSHYKMAAENGMSLSQLVNASYPTARADCTTFEQLMASAGLFLNAANDLGVRPPTMKEVLEGGVKLNVGTITRPDGADQTPSGRLLFPEVIMQVIESELRESNDDFLGALERMIAQSTSVISPKFEQPIVNIKAPEDSANQPIAQLAEPASMVTITVSETTRRIPTVSIGLTISDQAVESATLDLVGLTMAAQARGEQIRKAENDLTGMISGDTDIGESAVSTDTASTYDSSLSAGQISHKAWIKFLRTNYKKLSINWVLCDIDTALKIENRSGKPTNQDDNPQSPRIDSIPTVDNLSLIPPRILLVDSTIVGADTIYALDSRFAIRRVINVSASYQAIEQYVMRRATSFRVDYGSIMHKLFTDAWQGMTLT